MISKREVSKIYANVCASPCTCRYEKQWNAERFLALSSETASVSKAVSKEKKSVF